MAEQPRRRGVSLMLTEGKRGTKFLLGFTVAAWIDASLLLRGLSFIQTIIDPRDPIPARELSVHASRDLNRPGAKRTRLIKI